jgi:hypothetical protein
MKPDSRVVEHIREKFHLPYEKFAKAMELSTRLNAEACKEIFERVKEDEILLSDERIALAYAGGLMHSAPSRSLPEARIVVDELRSMHQRAVETEAESRNDLGLILALGLLNLNVQSKKTLNCEDDAAIEEMSALLDEQSKVKELLNETLNGRQITLASGEKIGVTDASPMCENRWSRRRKKKTAYAGY